MELLWTSLCGQPIELFKNSHTIGMCMLIFAQHMMQFNARQGVLSQKREERDIIYAFSKAGGAL